MTRNRLVTYSCSGIFVLLLGIFLSQETPAQSNRMTRELPVMVSVQDLLSDPERFDGHRVVVSGKVRDISILKGRRGGNYLFIRLESRKTSTGKSRPVIKVFSLLPAPVSSGNEVLVQGKYYIKGKSGGLPFENFIQAEAIMREPSGEGTP